MGPDLKTRVKLVEAAHFAYKRTFGSAVISPWCLHLGRARSVGRGLAAHGGNMRDDCLCNVVFLAAEIYESGVEASLAKTALVLVVGTLSKIPTSLILRGV